MKEDPASSTNSPGDLDAAKWEFEKAVRERELAIRDREQATKEQELEFKKTESQGANWRNPLVVGVFAAAIAASGNAVVSYFSGNAQRELEAQRAEQTRILEMIKTNDPDKAAVNLRFLVDAGLVSDPAVKGNVTTYLANRKPGSGTALPAVAESPKLSAPIVENARIYLRSGISMRAIKRRQKSWQNSCVFGLPQRP